MRLYHGSNVEVSKPRLMPCVRALDFGRAFYLTSDFEQASRWARTSVLRRGDGRPIVSVYEFDETAVSVLRMLRFEEPNAAWLKGAYSEEEALRRLLPQRLKDQFALKSDAALACLAFLEGRCL